MNYNFQVFNKRYFNITNSIFFIYENGNGTLFLINQKGICSQWKGIFLLGFHKTGRAHAACTLSDLFCMINYRTSTTKPVIASYLDVKNYFPSPLFAIFRFGWGEDMMVLFNFSIYRCVYLVNDRSNKKCYTAISSLPRRLDLGQQYLKLMLFNKPLSSWN